MDIKKIKAANLKAAKVLVAKYRAITKRDIELSLSKIEGAKAMSDALRLITGFGSIDTCSLCISAKQKENNCFNCIHWSDTCDNLLAENVSSEEEVLALNITPCSEEWLPSYPTYKAILTAKTPEELMVACKNRADYIEFLIQEKERML